MKRTIYTKFTAFALSALFVLSLLTATPLNASGSVGDARLDPGISITLDGQAALLVNERGEPVYPILYNGTTYVPVRGIAYLLGKHVGWDPTTRSVLLTDEAITAPSPLSAAKPDVTILTGLDPDQSIRIMYNGIEQTLEDVNGNRVYPILYNGTTYVPLRGIASLYGIAVDWIASSRTVTLESKPDTSANEFTDARKFTDVQLSGMLNLSATELKSRLSTVADATAFLDIKYPSLWHSYHLWQGEGSNFAVLRSGEEILDDTVESDAGRGLAGRSDIATAIAYLLSDDYTIGSIYCFSYDNTGEFNPIKSATYILSNGQYRIFDPVVGMAADMGCRAGDLLPEMTVTDLAAYAKAVENSPQMAGIASMYAIESGQRVTFSNINSWTRVITPNVAPLFADETKMLGDDAYYEKMYGHIKAENINEYQLPKILGGLTLSVSEAKALVGQPPEMIKAGVKTAGDLLLYMLAARIMLRNGDDSISVGGYTWHYNGPARQTLAENLGNCGRMANLANYLLEGDYQEIGFVLHSYYPGEGGGHVYNYIKYQDKYYIVDFSSYLFSNYNVQAEFNFLELARIEDYGGKWGECYGGLAAIITHTSTGTHLPNVWHEGGYYFPSDSEFSVLFETPGKGYEVRRMQRPSGVPDWRAPQ